jgi:hypothetical protein
MQLEHAMPSRNRKEVNGKYARSWEVETWGHTPKSLAIVKTLALVLCEKGTGADAAKRGHFIWLTL